MKDERLLELAISGLEAQRDRLEEELAQLRARVRGASKAAAVATARPTKGRKKSSKMSAAAKKTLSEKMKKIWAARRKGKK